MLLSELFQLIIPPGASVFDIGAYQGELSSFFSELVGPKGRVFSFEPHPGHFLELITRAAEEPSANIFPHCRAMAASVGHQPIFLAPPAFAQSSSIIPGLGSAAHLGEGVRRCLTETDTIDNFVRSYGQKPDVIKIDTEGAERLVVEGGRRTIETMHPTLVFEGVFGYDESQKEYSFKEPVPSHVAWLESIGYRIFVIDIDYLVGGWVKEGSVLYCTNYGLLAISSQEFRDLPLIGCNLLAVHCSKAAEMEKVEAAVSGRVVDLLASLNIQGKMNSLPQGG
jgi:FkbM family methyltransferase